jgi:uncharacterized protein YuzE
MDLIISYDSEADVLVLKFGEGLVDDVVLGYDCDGRVVSVEVLDASKRGLMNVLIELTKAKKEIVKLILSKISWGGRSA